MASSSGTLQLRLLSISPHPQTLMNESKFESSVAIDNREVDSNPALDSNSEGSQAPTQPAVEYHGTAAPTIVHDLQGVNFSWVGSAYALGAASCLPLSGNLAQIFGRRPILLGSLLLFAAGSAVAASARSMTVLIIGRAIQGVAGGGIRALTSIVWTLGSVIGPFIAGGLSSKASWRWLFYRLCWFASLDMNIPLCFLAFVVVACFLNVHTPRENLATKLLQVDWLGNAFIISSTCFCMLGLSWAGITFPWSSPQVLVPLIVGLAGLFWSVYYESRWPAKPTIPLAVLSNRTTLLGYLATLLHGIVAISVGCRWPSILFILVNELIFYPSLSAVRGASPITSGIYFLPISATISPSAIFQGRLVAKTGRYRTIILVGWCFMLLGIGLIYYMNLDTPLWQVVIFQLVQGFGMGLLYATTSKLHSRYLKMPAPFLAWGIAITGTILQNRLRHSLPPSLLSQFPENTEIAYSIIPQIPDMPEPLKSDVQKAFLDSMRVAWIVMEAVCGAGLVTFFSMKDVPLGRTTDKQWTLQDRKVQTEKTSGEQDVSEKASD
ncbi:MFS general substrate transporter [Mycena polygramma]|nr:MFS general substrate transporter [Mycena polygramma]